MAQEPDPRDGTIDFSSYSLAQLEQLRILISPEASPLNFANLLAELERRQATPLLDDPPATADPAVSGRFTSRDGVAGWLQAKRKRGALYGDGALEIVGNELALRGWQRTWLGVPVQMEKRVPLDEVRNVAFDGEWLRFELKHRFWPARVVEFKPDSAARGREIVAQLPTSQTRGFGKRWSEVSDFYRRLDAVTGRPWITPALVVANLAIFVTMWLLAGRPYQFEPQMLMNWGANFGPQTVNGQWWRLFSALFIHSNVAHVALNMWALWNVGRLTERLYGRTTFALLYVAAGGLASLTSVAWNPNVGSIGASGAIFGVFGAFLAFFVQPRRNQVPASIVRSHWVSTLAFVLFNLANGFLQEGIDNAAHVGGLLSGFFLGWILARPVHIEQRAGLPAIRTAAAVCFGGILALAGLWQVRGMGAQLTPSEQFVREHAWYMDGESKNLREWQTLATRAAQGSVSTAELGRTFERDILPFWQQAHERLSRETVPEEQRPYAALVAKFVDLRLQWTRALIDATKNEDQARAREAAQLMQKTQLVQARLERAALRASMLHRPRALSNAPYVLKIRALLSGNQWKCVKGPPWAGWSTDERDSPADGPAARDAAACRAQQLFMSGDYATLDAEMKRAVQTRGDLLDGSSTFDALFAGLDSLFDYGGFTVIDMLGRTADWRHAVPGSLEAELVEAEVLQIWAWSARGHGFAKETTPQAWAAFAYRTEMVAAALQDIETAGAANPMWHATSLDVGLDQSLEMDALRAIFERGAQQFPDYWPLHRSMLRILMPRWGGSYLKVDEFIQQMATRSGGERDESVYARLYWSYANLEQDEANIFDDGYAEWPSIRAGLNALIDKYPRSDYFLNGLARFACLSGNVVDYDAVRPQLEKRLSSTAWTEKTSIAKCDQRMAVARKKT